MEDVEQNTFCQPQTVKTFQARRAAKSVHLLKIFGADPFAVWRIQTLKQQTVNVQM